MLEFLNLKDEYSENDLEEALINHLYLNYAKEHWVREGENPPVGLILCTQKDSAVARYALDGLPNKVLASEYKTVLPDPEKIAEELAKARKILEGKIKC